MPEWAVYDHFMIADLKKVVRSCLLSVRKWMGDPKSKPMGRRVFLGCGGVTVFALFVSIALVILILFVGEKLVNRYVYDYVPSKKEIVHKFESNEATFNRLARMLSDEQFPDGYSYLYPQSSSPPEGISDERWAVYRELFERIGIEKRIYCSGNYVRINLVEPTGVMWFPTESGLIYTGDGKAPSLSYYAECEKVENHWFYYSEAGKAPY